LLHSRNIMDNELQTQTNAGNQIKAGGRTMPWVIAKPNELFESLMKRFKKAVERAGILSDYKKHESYEKPSVKQKRKRAAAKKRAVKRQKKLERIKARKGTNQNFKWNKDHTKKIPLPPPRKFTPKKDFTKGGTKRDYTKSGQNKNYKNSVPNRSKFTKNQSRPFNKGTKS